MPIKYLIIQGQTHATIKIIYYFILSILTLHLIKYLIIYLCEGQTHATFKIILYFIMSVGQTLANST